MSKEAAEHHRKAAQHHERVARHRAESSQSGQLCRWLAYRLYIHLLPAERGSFAYLQDFLFCACVPENRGVISAKP